MRAIEPWRSWIRNGWGSLSRIRVCSVEGPRGAKLGEPGAVEGVGDDGRDDALPSPGVFISPARFVRTLRNAPTF